MLARINWRPKPPEIRYFSITLAILAVVVAIVALALGKSGVALISGAGGFALALLSYFVPAVGRWLYLLWMAVTFVLASVISPIVIGIIFYLVLTPIALIFRLLGKDELRLRKPETTESYFADFDHDINAETFRRQF